MTDGWRQSRLRTGATSGIGLAIAERSRPRARSFSPAATRPGRGNWPTPRCAFLAGDVTEPGWQALVERRSIATPHRHPHQQCRIGIAARPGDLRQDSPGDGVIRSGVRFSRAAIKRMARVRKMSGGPCQHRLDWARGGARRVAYAPARCRRADDRAPPSTCAPGIRVNAERQASSSTGCWSRHPPSRRGSRRGLKRTWAIPMAGRPANEIAAASLLPATSQLLTGTPAGGRGNTGGCRCERGSP